MTDGTSMCMEKPLSAEAVRMQNGHERGAMMGKLSKQETVHTRDKKNGKQEEDQGGESK